ncbi:EGF-like domain-containing protein [Tanacetum coccineum]
MAVNIRLERKFMDFWLSFMAVVITFMYLAANDEASKRTIHIVVAMLTTLMAETGATRSSNIVLVIAIGEIGLLAGWLIKVFARYKRGWQIKGWFPNLVKTVLKRFWWFFVLPGFVALAMGAIRWSLESTESYWHSMWHVSIYTSSFFFLCSKVNIIDSEIQGSTNKNYQLTRQDSLPRGEEQPGNA